jgi:hypothetical protein
MDISGKDRVFVAYQAIDAGLSGIFERTTIFWVTIDTPNDRDSDEIVRKGKGILSYQR